MRSSIISSSYSVWSIVFLRNSFGNPRNEIIRLITETFEENKIDEKLSTRLFNDEESNHRKNEKTKRAYLVPTDIARTLTLTRTQIRFKQNKIDSEKVKKKIEKKKNEMWEH